MLDKHCARPKRHTTINPNTPKPPHPKTNKWNKTKPTKTKKQIKNNKNKNKKTKTTKPKETKTNKKKYFSVGGCRCERFKLKQADLYPLCSCLDGSKTAKTHRIDFGFKPVSECHNQCWVPQGNWTTWTPKVCRITIIIIMAFYGFWAIILRSFGGLGSTISGLTKHKHLSSKSALVCDFLSIVGRETVLTGVCFRVLQCMGGVSASD